MLHFSNFLGVAGVLLCCVAYVLLQIEKIDPKNLTYSGLNFLGSIGILFSLWHDWNLSAFLMECIWALASLYGVLWFFWKARRDSKTHSG